MAREAWPSVGLVPPQPRHVTLLATAALLAVTACWGSTFFLIKDLLERMPVLDFLAVRFAIATIVLCLLFPRALRRMSRAAVRQALVLGLLYGVGQILQTTGIGRTPAWRSTAGRSTRSLKRATSGSSASRRRAPYAAARLSAIWRRRCGDVATSLTRNAANPSMSPASSSMVTP